MQLKTESLFYVFLASVLMINAYYGIRLGRGEFFKLYLLLDLQCLCYLEFLLSDGIWRKSFFDRD